MARCKVSYNTKSHYTKIYNIFFSGNNEFKKLQTSSSIDICLEDLKTKCNASVRSITVSVAFKITDIEKMLETSLNPVATFTSAVSADILNFIATVNLSEFRDNYHKLNDISNFPITNKRAGEIGFFLEHTDFCGYTLNELLENETERHRIELDAQSKLADIRCSEQAKLMADKVKFLSQLKKLDVDLTQILVAENGNNFIKNVFTPQDVTRLIQKQIVNKQENNKE